MAQSKRSGGPKTAAGKMASAHNAIKTGAYSSLIIFPGESEEDFRELEEQFVRDFNPEDVVAAAMVHTLTVQTWKKLRAQKVEHAGLLRTLTIKFELTDYARISFPFAITDALTLLTLVNAMSQAEEDKWKLAFGFCKQYIETIPTDQELKTLAQSSPLLYDFLEAKAVIHKRQDCALWPTFKVKTANGMAYPFIKYYCEQFVIDQHDTAMVIAHIVRLRQIIKDIKEARLLRYMQHSGLQRVHDDLDRAFYRTLTELRKHQNWRQERNTVDVTSED